MLGSILQDIDWIAVEAIATTVAVVIAAVAGALAYRTWCDASATLKSQQTMLQIEQERWAEERHEILAASRRTAGLLSVVTDIAPSGDGGLVMRLENKASAPFEDIVVEADPDHPQPDDRASSFGYLVSSLRPGEVHEHPIALPTGLWWRVRYLDIGGRQWAQSPEAELPYRLD